MDFSELIERRFPHLPAEGFYVRPQLPATQLGRVLASNTRISSPADVVAFYRFSTTFSSGSVVLTGSDCFFDGGSFRLADLRGAQADGKQVVVHLAGPTQQQLRCGSESDARRLATALEAVANAPKAETLLASVDAYASFSPEAVQWLELRDEVLRTVERLNELFQDGKISLLEFEETRERLLSRL